MMRFPALAVAVLALSLTSGAAATVPVPTATLPELVEGQAPWQTCSRTFDGVRATVSASQKTITIVNQTTKTHARVSFWVREDGACAFDRKFLTKTARLGYGGTVAGSKRKQGTGTTPRGTYTMTEAFGNGAAPATTMPWHTVRSGDYWVSDNKSDYYNSLRNKADGGFRWRLRSSVNSSEKLRSFPHQYRYVVVINFNRAPDTKKHYRGSGIFLHVKSSGATGGCVGVTAKQMRIVLADLQSGDTIKITK